MSLETDIAHLREQLERLASEAEPDLPLRFALTPPPSELGLSLYRRMRIALGRVLRELGIRRAPVPDPWLPSLRPKRPGDSDHKQGDGASALVIWALGTDRDTLRTACRGFQALADALPGFAPVLVTDVADFAFFSRLGWLVEYVPTFSAPAQRYAERKQRHLARLYRGAPALPVSAGLRDDLRPELVLEQVARGRRG